MKYYKFKDFGQIKGDVYVAQFENYAIIASECHIYRQSGFVSISNIEKFKIPKEVFEMEYYKIINKFQF